jgi:transcriptional regulator with XRE-family HTH domain
MQPFGETILAWRLSRGMTQADLANAARIHRPNLSAIERGEREVTLKTLRALAVALDVTPGTLANGIAPEAGARPLSRRALERIARAVVRGTDVVDPREAALASHLRSAMSARLALGRKRHDSRALTAGADRAYFLLRTRESRETVASLLDRVALELKRT